MAYFWELACIPNHRGLPMPTVMSERDIVEENCF